MLHVNAKDEIVNWKQKYDSLAKLYAQLRKEHLDLLNKFKTLKAQGTKVNDETRKLAESLKLELKAKQSELTDVLVERNRLKDDTGLFACYFDIFRSHSTAVRGRVCPVEAGSRGEQGIPAGTVKLKRAGSFVNCVALYCGANTA